MYGLVVKMRVKKFSPWYIVDHIPDRARKQQRSFLSNTKFPLALFPLLQYPSAANRGDPPLRRRSD